MRLGGWTLVFIILAVQVAADPICTSGVVWNYCSCGECELNGPANWGTLGGPNWPECTGRTITQSPATLTAPRFRAMGPLTLRYQAMNLTMANTGHAIKVLPTAPQFVTLDQGPRLFLKEFHFHVPAEHSLPGVKAMAEMHLVHASEGDSVPTAIAVLLVEAPTPNLALAAIVSTAATVPMCDESRTTSPVDLSELVPQSVASSFLAYSGSLTTPPCTGVRWLILTTPISVSHDQVERLNLFGANARPSSGKPVEVTCWPEGANCRQ
ncbi:MAG: carbonic anhydrase family protein [Thermoanaerobaculia bacterium]